LPAYRAPLADEQVVGRYLVWGDTTIWTDTCSNGIKVDHAGRLQGEIPMDNSTKDRVEGKFHEVKGKVKEKVGQVTNDPNLESEGQDEKLAGKVQKRIGNVEKVFEKQ
jgi:uncharacterized protein YjbJ (UPF0337 family)